MRKINATAELVISYSLVWIHFKVNTVAMEILILVFQFTDKIGSSSVEIGCTP